jgi:hypothetical protein
VARDRQRLSRMPAAEKSPPRCKCVVVHHLSLIT